MSALNQLAQYLPFLRRYARALTGDQITGDNYVRATLEAIAGEGLSDEEGLTPRVSLYRAFHAIWVSSGAQLESRDDDALEAASAENQLMHVAPRSREAYLLTAMESFSFEEAAAILGVDPGEIQALIEAAEAQDESLFARDVLIIEDEPIISADLEGIVAELGHRVSGVAATREAAVAAAARQRPGLILSDINLADGSSGTDAVNDILTDCDAPVVLITAYPERLLTGTGPEPTFLITKPFRPETVKAAIAQAVFMHSRSMRPTLAAR